MNHFDDVQITSNGIKKTLNAYTPARAVAEFVWNGFDANATAVTLDLATRSSGSLFIEDEFTVHDNGEGIPYEELDSKFRPFLESQKAAKKNKLFRESRVQGDEGRGRLTFFKFAQQARWETVYEKGGERFAYQISVAADSLHTYSSTEPEQTTLPTGTRVVFGKLTPQLGRHFLRTEGAAQLQTEFCWFLELNRKKNLQILLEGKGLDWRVRIADKDEFSFDESGYRFRARYIRWNEFIPEFSKYYYLNASDEEQFKENTTFNNKGDFFFHSIYVASDYFDGLVSPESQFEAGQTELFKKDKEPYVVVKRKLGEYLKGKRKRVLRATSEELLTTYEREGVFPRFKTTAYDAERKKDLCELIKALYLAEPRVFQELNIEQKKTFVGLLNILLDSDERDRVLSIIEEAIRLEPQEQQELVALLRTTTLNRIIRTIKLIEDRYRAVQLMKQLVFNQALKADEVHDLQAAIEAHYWLFGEEYHLVTAAEPSFEKALRRLIYKEKGLDAEVALSHPEKLGQMDIFAVREVIHSNRVECIVVELKHPKNVVLGEKELGQVKRYKEVIQSDQQFNASNRSWTFVLVGNAYNTYIEQELENSRRHGEGSLVFNVGNCKIYVKTWSEIFVDFECRHNFLNQQLELKRDALKSEARTKSQAIAELQASSAKSPSEILVPSEER